MAHEDSEGFKINQSWYAELVRVAGALPDLWEPKHLALRRGARRSSRSPNRVASEAVAIGLELLDGRNLPPAVWGCFVGPCRVDVDHLPETARTVLASFTSDVRSDVLRTALLLGLDEVAAEHAPVVVSTFGDLRRRRDISRAALQRVHEEHSVIETAFMNGLRLPLRLDWTDVPASADGVAYVSESVRWPGEAEPRIVTWHGIGSTVDIPWYEVVRWGRERDRGGTGTSTIVTEHAHWTILDARE